MRCRVVKDAKGKIVAAYPIAAGEIKFELELKRGQKAVEVDIREDDMRDAERFRRAASAVR